MIIPYYNESFLHAATLVVMPSVVVVLLEVMNWSFDIIVGPHYCDHAKRKALDHCRVDSSRVIWLDGLDNSGWYVWFHFGS